ncbi:MAG: YceI family protein [Bdellovibrionales bacterium]|nr:YceI family protein [Bdellovibrionales bacterium]
MFKQLVIASLLVSSVSFAKDAKKAAKAAPAAAAKIQVDPATSKVVYLGKKVTGEHTGEVKVQDGQLAFEGDVLKSAEVTIDMTTINNTDLADKEYNKKFVDHMNSDDFFSTTKFKTAKLVTKSVKKVKDNTYTITGDLTIKGKTSPVTFDADATKESVKAVVKFDRTKYDIKYGSGQFFQGLGDKMINDDVQLTVTLTAKK